MNKDFNLCDYLLKGSLFKKIQKNGQFIKARKTIILIISILFTMSGFSILGIYTYFIPRGEPDLYLNFDFTALNDIDLKNINEYVCKKNRFSAEKIPEEAIHIPAVIPESFYELTNILESDDIFTARYITHLLIMNSGDYPVSDVWFKIYFDPMISLVPLNLGRTCSDGECTENPDKNYIKFIKNVEYGYDDDMNKNYLYFNPKNFNLNKEEINCSFDALILNFPPIEKIYNLHYFIGGKNIKTKERDLQIRVTTEDIPSQYIDNAIALELANSGHFTQSLDKFKKVVDAEPKIAAFHFNLGQVLIALGRSQEAEEHLKLASQIAPTISEIWTTLGSVSLKLGHLDIAEIAINNARSFQEDSHSIINIYNKYYLSFLFENGFNSRISKTEGQELGQKAMQYAQMQTCAYLVIKEDKCSSFWKEGYYYNKDDTK